MHPNYPNICIIRMQNSHHSYRTLVQRGEFNQLMIFLQRQDYEVYGSLAISEESKISGPEEYGGKIEVDIIDKPEDIILSGELPFFSFKRLFIPEKEILFEYKKRKATPVLDKTRRVIAGINLLDLKSVLLYDQVFEKDPYYQARRENTVIIGHSLVPPIENNIFAVKYEEDILEHLAFDIFLADAGDHFKVFAGSEKGKNILEEFGYFDYTFIQFSGPAREESNTRMQEIHNKMKEHFNADIWNKLGEICLECGKCTIISPTCFCFRIDDQPARIATQSVAGGPIDNIRERCWDSCFYREFSEISGRNKFLNNTAKRIHFWYYHKFVRIPEEYGIEGCVGCGRCHFVCPVRINIKKVLGEILEN